MFGSDVVLRRALISTAAAALTAGSVVAAGAASADVHVDAEEPVRGEYAVVTFQVPNESDTASPTTKVIVTLPRGTSISARAMDGWTDSLERDTATGTVRSITWSADPAGGIPADHFEVFEVNVKLPEAGTATFPVTQIYADGTTIRWDQRPLVHRAEPERPAPMLTLLPVARRLLGGHPRERPLASLGATAAVQEQQLGPDNVARALGGGALLLATLGVGISVVRRRG